MDMIFRADLAADVSMRSKYEAIAAKKICAPCKRYRWVTYTRRTADQKRKGYGRRAGSGTMHHIKLFQKMAYPLSAVWSIRSLGRSTPFRSHTMMTTRFAPDFNVTGVPIAAFVCFLWPTSPYRATIHIMAAQVDRRKRIRRIVNLFLLVFATEDRFFPFLQYNLVFKPCRMGLLRQFLRNRRSIAAFSAVFYPGNPAKNTLKIALVARYSSFFTPIYLFYHQMSEICDERQKLHFCLGADGALPILRHAFLSSPPRPRFIFSCEAFATHFRYERCDAAVYIFHKNKQNRNF